MSFTNKIMAVLCMVLTPIIYPIERLSDSPFKCKSLKDYFETIKFGWNLKD